MKAVTSRLFIALLLITISSVVSAQEGVESRPAPIIPETVRLTQPTKKTLLFEQKGERNGGNEVPFRYTFVRRIWLLPQAEFQAVNVPTWLRAMVQGIDHSIELKLDENTDGKPAIRPESGALLQFELEVRSSNSDKTEPTAKNHSDLTLELHADGSYYSTTGKKIQVNGEEEDEFKDIPVGGLSFLVTSQPQTETKRKYYLVFADHIKDSDNTTLQSFLTAQAGTAVSSTYSPVLLGAKESTAATLTTEGKETLKLTEAQGANREYIGYYLDNDRNLVLISKDEKFLLKLVLPE